jgi:pimeloyl-ACP methyl ester carboxylesterase
MDNSQLTNTINLETAANTYTIHYRILGVPDGQPLIFIHGTPWSSRIWAPYAQAYASTFRVYLFDNPGYGESPGGIPISDSKAEPNVSLACQAEAFACLVKAWSLSEPPHVIAHDFGGIISLRAHLCHGIQYASLCLVDPLAVSPFGSPVFRLVASNAEIFNSLPSHLSEAMVRSYIREAAFKPLSQAIEDMLVKPWTASGLQGMEGFIRQVKQADQRDIEEVEQRFREVGQKMPVKIIWGKEDIWIPADRAEKLAQLIGTEDVVIVEDAGHLIHYDQPVRLAVELTKWFQSMKGVRQH